MKIKLRGEVSWQPVGPESRRIAFLCSKSSCHIQAAGGKYRKNRKLYRKDEQLPCTCKAQHKQRKGPAAIASRPVKNSLFSYNTNL